ncbi:MAG: carboxypeptidase regulatory-like domain-containing protein [Planctomycetes bacterium]|nr:carboxypeptidase regulatory-like domain-containing protein [Planctomycetota bacterium]
MQTRPSMLLALFALVVLGGLGACAWWLLFRGSAQATPTGIESGVRTGAAVHDNVPDPGQVRMESLQLAPSTSTPLGLPIEVELELLRANPPEGGAGATPFGSAATARLKGSVFSGIGAPVAAEVRFEHGPNQGRVLQCDPTGRFGATNLYPGLAVVTVRADGIPGSERVVRLRQKTETELNIGYGKLTEVTGEVLTRDGLPLADAIVSFDGQEAKSDEKGLFHFDGVATGQVLVLVRKPGYASVQEQLTIPFGKKIEKGQIKYVLEKGGRLILSIPGPASGEVEALCIITQDGSLGTQHSYPWFLVNPVHLWPGGGSKTVEDLPAGSFTLRVFQPGAVGNPAQKSARLDVGGEAQVELGLTPAPTVHGIVRLNGQPVHKAEVTLEASDRVAATLTAFGAPNEFFLESEVLCDAPPAVQRTLTDPSGLYVLSSWENVGKERYLVARYDNGRQMATKLLRGGEEVVDLDLKPSATGDGLLRIALSERERALPVRILVNGEPRPLAQLPAGQDLKVDELNRGVWKLSLRYNGAILAAGKEVEIGEETALRFDLPQ